MYLRTAHFLLSFTDRVDMHLSAQAFVDAFERKLRKEKKEWTQVTTNLKGLNFYSR